MKIKRIVLIFIVLCMMAVASIQCFATAENEGDSAYTCAEKFMNAFYIQNVGDMMKYSFDTRFENQEERREFLIEGMGREEETISNFTLKEEAKFLTDGSPVYQVDIEYMNGDMMTLPLIIKNIDGQNKVYMLADEYEYNALKYIGDSVKCSVTEIPDDNSIDEAIKFRERLYSDGISIGMIGFANLRNMMALKNRSL